MRRFLIVLAIVVGLFTVVGFFLPSSWAVERSALIPVPEARVRSILMATDTWPEWWPPWTLARDAGKPLKFSWVDGQLRWQQRGVDGTLTLEESEEVLHCRVTLGAATESARITLTPADGGTKVAWAMDGEIGWNPWQRWVVATGELTDAVESNLDMALAALAARALLPAEIPDQPK